MSHLERWLEDGRESDDDDDDPAFLRPTAQSERRTEAARADLMMVEQHEAIQRDQGIEKSSVVDQTQFRNTQINEGYQHNTVIRQPTARDVAGDKASPTLILDKRPEAVLLRKEKKRLREGGSTEIAGREESKESYKKQKKKKKEGKKHSKKDKKKTKKHSKLKEKKKKKKVKKHGMKEVVDDEDSSSGGSSEEDDAGDQQGSGSSHDEDDADKPTGPSLPMIENQGVEADPFLALEALGSLRKLLIKAIARQR